MSGLIGVCRKLTDWDDDDPQALQDTSSRRDKVVILKHMFTLDELEVSLALHPLSPCLISTRTIPVPCWRSKKRSATNVPSSAK